MLSMGKLKTLNAAEEEDVLRLNDYDSAVESVWYEKCRERQAPICTVRYLDERANVEIDLVEATFTLRGCHESIVQIMKRYGPDPWFAQHGPELLKLYDLPHENVAPALRELRAICVSHAIPRPELRQEAAKPSSGEAT